MFSGAPGLTGLDNLAVQGHHVPEMTLLSQMAAFPGTSTSLGGIYVPLHNPLLAK